MTTSQTREKNPARVRAGRARQQHLRHELGEEGYRAHQKALAYISNAAQLAALGLDGYRRQRREAYQALVDKIGKAKAEARVKRATEARRQWRLEHPTRGELILQCTLEALGFRLVRSRKPFRYRHDCDDLADTLTERTVIIEAYVGCYICDALLPLAGVAIEVYGGVHCLQTVRDACRKRALERTGLRVLILGDTMTSNDMRRAIVAALRER